MKTVALRTVDGRWIAREVRMGCSFASRCLGLMRTKALGEQQGLLLTPARTAHTLGLRYAIDVVFLSRQMRVLALAPTVPPWSLRAAPPGTGRVLELAAGRIAATGLMPGTYVLVESSVDLDANLATTRPMLPTRQPCERQPIRFSLRLPGIHPASQGVRSAAAPRTLRRPEEPP
jgi:uncharacterized membrane protein (UPF0127 family)